MIASVRIHKFHIITILFFLVMMILIWHHTDSAMWIGLFLVIILNASLFIAGKSIPTLAWLVVVISILGIIMCLPLLWKWAATSAGISSEQNVPQAPFRSLLYFGLAVLFSALQVRRTLH